MPWCTRSNSVFGITISHKGWWSRWLFGGRIIYYRCGSCNKLSVLRKGFRGGVCACMRERVVNGTTLRWWPRANNNYMARSFTPGHCRTIDKTTLTLGGHIWPLVSPPGGQIGIVHVARLQPQTDFGSLLASGFRVWHTEVAVRRNTLTHNQSRCGHRANECVCMCSLVCTLFPGRCKDVGRKGFNELKIH